MPTLENSGRGSAKLLDAPAAVAAPSLKAMSKVLGVKTGISAAAVMAESVTLSAAMEKRNVSAGLTVPSFAS